MPVSDYLIALTLALYPQTDHKLMTSVSADALAQPNGGVAMAVAPPGEGKKVQDIKTQSLSPMVKTAPTSCASGEHMIKFWRTEARGKVQAAKCAPIKYGGTIKYDAATGQHFPK